jgi:hypothetical protein
MERKQNILYSDTLSKFLRNKGNNTLPRFINTAVDFFRNRILFGLLYREHPTR